MAFDVNKALSEQLSNPAYLARVMAGWRKIVGLSQREAAESLSLPLRTLQGIEQGRGFRYPELLNMAMIHIDHGLAEARRLSSAQAKAFIERADRAVEKEHEEWRRKYSHENPSGMDQGADARRHE